MYLRDYKNGERVWVDDPSQFTVDGSPCFGRVCVVRGSNHHVFSIVDALAARILNREDVCGSAGNVAKVEG